MDPESVGAVVQVETEPVEVLPLEVGFVTGGTTIHPPPPPLLHPPPPPPPPPPDVLTQEFPESVYPKLHVMVQLGYGAMVPFIGALVGHWKAYDLVAREVFRQRSMANMERFEFVEIENGTE